MGILTAERCRGGRWIVAAAPAPLLLFIGTEVAWIRRCDELRPGIVLESPAVSLPAAFGLFTLLDLLEATEVVAAWISVDELWPLMAILWAVAHVIVERRYR